MIPKTKKTTNSFFTVSKLEKINFKKYNFTQKKYIEYVKKMLDIMLEMPQIQKSTIFNDKVHKIRFDIAFCKDETIKKINKEYRKKDKPTDVITFSLYYDDKNSFIYRKTAELGQIIISVETADKQKDENNNTFFDEILTLTCHGILHLLGFDHLEKKDYDFVVGIQDKILRKL